MKGLIVHPVVREHMCGILKVPNVVPNGDPRYKHCAVTDCHSQCLVVENNNKNIHYKVVGWYYSVLMKKVCCYQ